MNSKFQVRYVIAVISCLLILLLCYELFQNLRPAHGQDPLIPSTIFQDSTTPSFTISTTLASGTISYSVSNYSGATVTRGVAQVTNTQTQLTLPQLPDDYYVLQITDNTGGSATGQTIPFAVVSPFTPVANSSFGVGVHFTGGNNPGLASLIATMGAGTIRDDASWAMIEKSPGNYNFGSFDSYMQVLQQNSIDPLLILDYNNRFYDNNHTPYDDTGLSAFANYAKALVTHYGQQLKAVEVYNEYNGMQSTGPCTRKPDCYARMLRYVYQAIKSVRPDVTVVGGAVLFADLNWFRRLFESGGLPYMDVISDHPYTTLYITSPELQGLQAQMRGLQELIKSFNAGKAKPVWITEIGWPTFFLTMNEHKQADYLVRGMLLAQAAGVQKIFWYDFLNDGTNTSKLEQNFGLLRRPDAAGQYMPKPAYVAYAVLSRELANRSYIGREAVMPGIFDMRYSDNLRIFWSTPFEQSVDLTTTGPVTATSVTGRIQTLRPTAGHIILNLSADPVYVQGNISSVTWHNPFGV